MTEKIDLKYLASQMDRLLSEFSKLREKIDGTGQTYANLLEEISFVRGELRALNQELEVLLHPDRK